MLRRVRYLLKDAREKIAAVWAARTQHWVGRQQTAFFASDVQPETAQPQKTRPLKSSGTPPKYPTSTVLLNLACADVGKNLLEFKQRCLGKDRREIEFLLGERLAIALPIGPIDTELLEEQRDFARRVFGHAAIELQWPKLAQHLTEDSRDLLRCGRPVPILSPMYSGARSIFDVTPKGYVFPTVSRGQLSRASM